MKNSITKLLTQLVRNKNVPDLHSFLASIDGGRVYVSACPEGGVFLEYWNSQTGSGSASWAGAVKDAADRLDMLGLDLRSVDM